MQAFWVRTSTDASTLTFTNTMRSHQSSNPLKALAKKDENMQILRLQVSNGTNTDETVLYSNVNASNNFDEYDAPKMFNNSTSMPEIYTVVNSEQLAINGLNTIQNDIEIPLGFSTLSSGTFIIKASQLSNFDAGTKVILKDYQDSNNPVISDLSDCSSYSFSSTVTSNNTNRFTLVFRAPGASTGIDNATKLKAQVFVNEANKIVVASTEKMNVSIYNALGQKLYERSLISTRTIIDKAYGAGVYFVELTLNGKSEIQKVIIR
jgi:hypothetical protein